MDINFSVFIATSLDGFIARPNGKLDWLEEAGRQGDPQDYGYRRFMDSVNCVVMGRRTFERIARLSEWPYQGKQVIVLSRTLKTPPADFANKIDLFCGRVELLAVELQHYKVQKVYVDGGIAIQSFLNAGLIDDLIITQIPVLIGRGIPLFSDIHDDVRLKLIQSQSFPSGFVQSHYRVVRRTKNAID